MSKVSETMKKQQRLICTALLNCCWSLSRWKRTTKRIIFSGWPGSAFGSEVFVQIGGSLQRNTAKTQQHKQDLPTSQRCHFSVASLQLIASHPSGLWLYILVLTCRHSPELRHRIVSPRGCWEQVSAPSGALFGGRFMLSWGRFLRV